MRAKATRQTSFTAIVIFEIRYTVHFASHECFDAKLKLDLTIESLRDLDLDLAVKDCNILSRSS